MSSAPHADFVTLARLLDDPSPVVRQALIGAFRDLGEPAVEKLRELAGGEGDLAGAASEVLEALGDADHAGAFRRYLRSPDPGIEKGCLLFERILRPETAPEAIAGPLDAMAGRVRELLDGTMSVREACRIVNRVVFHEWGYRGDEKLFLQPDGSLLGRVLVTRRGIPISLCLVHLLVANRCGIPLKPVGLPGRFMLGHRCGEPDGFFVDCYDGGVFRSRTEVKMILLQNGLPATDDFLAPVEADEVLCRCCRNLASQLDAVGDCARAEIFLGFVREVEKPGPHA